MNLPRITCSEYMRGKPRVSSGSIPENFWNAFESVRTASRVAYEAEGILVLDGTNLARKLEPWRVPGDWHFGSALHPSSLFFHDIESIIRDSVDLGRYLQPSGQIAHACYDILDAAGLALESFLDELDFGPPLRSWILAVPSNRSCTRSVYRGGST